MTPSHRQATGYAKRMAEDMTIRNFADATIDTYTYHVGKFSQLLGKRLDQAIPEDIRSFQLHKSSRR